MKFIPDKKNQQCIELILYRVGSYPCAMPHRNLRCTEHFYWVSFYIADTMS